MQTIAPMRRAHAAPVPPATRLSEERFTIVMVTTTVERSRSPMLFTAAACAPRSSARKPVMAIMTPVSSVPTASQTTASARVSRVPVARIHTEERGRCTSVGARRVMRDAMTAPSMKATSATRLLSTGMSATPTRPKPMKSTLPVMLPVKTRSSAR